MKMKTLVVTLLFSAGAVSAIAQTDSICNVNSSISHEAVKAGNLKDAYEPWKVVMERCPTLRFYTYTDGFDILKALMSQHGKDTPEYKKYFDELMSSYDQLLQYLPEMRKQIRNLRTDGRYLGDKATDYMQFAPSIDINLVYGWFSKAVGEDQAKTSNINHFFALMQASAEKLKVDPAHKEAFIQDYLNVSEWIDQAVANSKSEAIKGGLAQIKEASDAMFINSGAADCASLQSIYGPKVEENKENIEYLRKVLDVMRAMKCTEEEAYFQASYYAYQIEPTPEAAAGCGIMAYKKGDIDGAIKFFDEAIEIEADNERKAEYAYRVAYILSTEKKLQQSRSYAQRAISLNPNFGFPHILIASLYAISPNWSDEPGLNKCTYFVILDRLNRAKAVDSSPEVQEEANRQIRAYSPHTPALSEVFMLGYKKGDKVTVGGWINETTTIR